MAGIGISPGVPDEQGPGRPYNMGASAMGMGRMLPQDIDGSATSYYDSRSLHASAAEDPRSYPLDDSVMDEGRSFEYPSREKLESFNEDSEVEGEEELRLAEGISYSPLAIMPPVGDWYEANSLEDQEREIRRLLANKNNVMAFPLNTHFTVSELEGAEWKLSDVCTREGENAPYTFKGSKFHDDRAIKNIYLKSVSQDSPVSVGVTASLIHPTSDRETMMFLRPYLPASSEMGPCHLSLKPKETSGEKVLLWTKDYSKPVPSIVSSNPSVTQRDLVNSLGIHPRDRRLRTLLADDILLQYVRQRIKLGIMSKEENPIGWQQYDGYGVIDAHRADSLIDKFIRDQSRGLYLKNIWDLRIKLSRGGLPSISADASEDNSELITEVPVFSHGSTKDVNEYTSRVRKSVPYNLWWTIQIELEPEKSRSGSY